MNRFFFALLGLALVAGAARAENPKVVIKTSMGDITVELFQDKAPITVKNFLDYVEAKHYDNTVFHRIIGDFMIQGGGFQPGLKKLETKPAIKNEASNGVSNARGTIAMARTNVPDSATDQFFINVVDNGSKLDRNEDSAGYAVFGKVVDGMDVVDKIKAVKTGVKLGMKDVPLEDVVIQSIRVK
jgi:cyclophilin family peptidyl-prolyl cis-trans isomerase